MMQFILTSKPGEYRVYTNLALEAPTIGDKIPKKKKYNITTEEHRENNYSLRSYFFFFHIFNSVYHHVGYLLKLISFES